MKQSEILIRYGEIGLKSEYTRRQFTHHLKRNIMHAFLQENLPVNITLKRGRIFLHTDKIKKSSEILKKIFGIVSFSPVWKSSSELSRLTEDVLHLMKNHLTAQTSFALRVRRSGIHSYSSQDAAVHIGQVVCDHFHAPVDLNQPDVELFIEIRDEQAFLFLKKIKGVGGLPYGTQGTVCCMVKNQKDLLASWFLMKRGCAIHFIIFDGTLYDQTEHFLDNWYIDKKQVTYSQKNQKNIHDFIQKEIQKHHCLALCDGITCQQDMKELVSEIKNVQEQYFLPILTPLISKTKEEIGKSMQKVGIT